MESSKLELRRALVSRILQFESTKLTADRNRKSHFENHLTL